MTKEINMETNKLKESKNGFKGIPVLTSEDLRVVLLELLNTIFWCWFYVWAFLYGTKLILGIVTKIYS
jgi:hypothetical protein